MSFMKTHWRVIAAAILGALTAWGVPSTVLEPLRAWLGF
jgi:hypothetical protein